MNGHEKRQSGAGKGDKAVCAAVAIEEVVGTGRGRMDVSQGEGEEEREDVVFVVVVVVEAGSVEEEEDGRVEVGREDEAVSERAVG